MVTYDTFEAAEGAKQDGQTICGAFRGDRPVYFLAPADSEDWQLREMAFEVVHYRPMTDVEKVLTSAALDVAPEKFAASVEDLAK